MIRPYWNKFYDKLLGYELAFGNKIQDFLQIFLHYLQIHRLKKCLDLKSSASLSFFNFIVL